MGKPKNFSARSIRESVSSLPGTFYGDECNISFNSSDIIRRSVSAGEPVRFDNLGISFCYGGEISSEVNLVHQTVRNGEFELYSPGTIYRYSSMSEDCALVGIAFSPYLVKELFKNDAQIMASIGESHRITLNENERHVFMGMAKVYLETLQRYGENIPLTRQMALCILLFAGRVIQEHGSTVASPRNRSAEICSKFVRILNQTKGTKRTIGYFAERLCVSNHYLSMAVKQTSGQSVKSLIDKSVVTEIKILLLHSDLSIAQIAEKMEFPSSTYLCKYFRAKTGDTPLKFRHQR